MVLFVGTYLAIANVCTKLNIHRQMTMINTKFKNNYLENIFLVVQRSYKVDNDIDLLVWLQNSVSEYIPHDMLLAVSGDFDPQATESKFHYDVVSNIGGISSQSAMALSAEMKDCVTYLYRLWLNNDCHWYALNHIKETEFYNIFKTVYPEQSHELNSLLVYGVNGFYAGNVCMYILFSKQNAFEVQNESLKLLMPHVDHTLRRIQHVDYLNPSIRTEVPVSLSSLSLRELEVINWIKYGKTNQEIAQILNISQNTVKSHLKRIFQKLNIGRRAQAVALLLSQ